MKPAHAISLFALFILSLLACDPPEAGRPGAVTGQGGNALAGVSVQFYESNQ